MRTALGVSLLLLIACGGGPQSPTTSVPGRGAISVHVDPNPIRATKVFRNEYAFPFHVVVRETGGRPVNVTRVSATVHGPGGITYAREIWDAERIRSMGYATSIGPNGELRYDFSPRREVPDERLIDSVSARLTVDGADDTGAPASASTVVTVTR